MATTSKVVALLRGVNVSGQKKIRMAELREALRAAGLADAETYLASGNVICSGEAGTVATTVSATIASRFGFDVPVTARTPTELTWTVESQPFPEPLDTKMLYVAFLFSKPAEDRVRELEREQFGSEQIIVKDQTAYLLYPDGAGKAKLDNSLVEKRLGVTSTMRNWRSVNNLRALAYGEAIT